VAELDQQVDVAVVQGLVAGDGAEKAQRAHAEKVTDFVSVSFQCVDRLLQDLDRRLVARFEGLDSRRTDGRTWH